MSIILNLSFLSAPRIQHNGIQSYSTQHIVKNMTHGMITFDAKCSRFFFKLSVILLNADKSIIVKLNLKTPLYVSPFNRKNMPFNQYYDTLNRNTLMTLIIDILSYY